MLELYLYLVQAGVVLGILVILLTIVNVAELACLVLLAKKMLKQGDRVWGWIVGIAGGVSVFGLWIGIALPGLRLGMPIFKLLATLAILIVGWPRHRRYNATGTMATYSLLVGLELLLLMVLAISIDRFFSGFK